MKKSMFLVALFSIINCYIAHSQLEVKFYTGAFDRFGLAFEYDINDRTGIEVGGSFNTKTDDVSGSSGFYVKTKRLKKNNIYINSKIKRYSKNERFRTRFFYGAYLRYWQHAKIVAGMDDWLAQNQDIAEKKNPWLSTRQHKFSIGALTGLKGRISKSFTWEATTGLGFSPPPLYTSHEETLKRTTVDKIGPDNSMWQLGYLNHLSILGQISIGYEF